MKIKKLDWDSSFFEINVGEAIVENDDFHFDNQNDFDLIYTKSKNDILIKLENFDSTYKEVKVVFEKSIDPLEINTNSDKNIISLFSIDITDEIKNQLYDLAFESGKLSRFKQDDSFSEASFLKLYRTWVDNSISKKFADDIFIYFQDNIIHGFVTVKLNQDSSANLGLLATSLAMQGKGIGSKLIQKTEEYIYSMSKIKVKIPTQLENSNACAFYSKNEYKICESTVIQHYWKKNNFNDSI